MALYFWLYISSRVYSILEATKQRFLNLSTTDIVGQIFLCCRRAALCLYLWAPSFTDLHPKKTPDAWGFCYGLNVDVLPQFMYLNPNPQGDGIRRWLSHGVGALMIGINAFIKEAPKNSLAPFHMWRHSERVPSKNQKVALLRFQICQCLDPILPSFQNWGWEPVPWSYPVDNILLQKLKCTKTNPCDRRWG